MEMARERVGGHFSTRSFRFHCRCPVPSPQLLNDSLLRRFAQLWSTREFSYLRRLRAKLAKGSLSTLRPSCRLRARLFASRTPFVLRFDCSDKKSTSPTSSRWKLSDSHARSFFV